MAKKKVQMMPFDTSDWLRCPELKVLPPDVRGLWMDMLCYMWESVERGVMVKPTGEIYTQDEIIRMLGRDASGSDTWLDQLIFGGVCGVRADGAIYSRRMVRSAEISEKRRVAGLKGGSATKSKVFSQKPPEPAKTAPVQMELPLDDPEPTAPPELTAEQKEKAAKKVKYKYAEFVTLTRDEYAKLCEQFGEDPAKRMVEILDNYKGAKGKRYRSDYRAILTWVVDRYNEEIIKYGDQRKANDTNGSSENNQGSPAAAVQADSGASGSAQEKAQKDYSERF